MSKWLWLSCLAGLAIAQTGAPVQPTFRVGTRLVELDVVVLNDKTPVRNLTKDDFTVQDKGKTQNIALFSVVEAHKAPKAAPLAANVSSNRMNNQGESTSNATVILFDKMNTPSADQAVARRQTLALLSTLKQTDHVAFYSLDTDLNMVQDFTDGAERLADAAKSLSAQGQDAAPAGSPEDQALAGCSSELPHGLSAGRGRLHQGGLHDDRLPDHRAPPGRHSGQEESDLADGQHSVHIWNGSGAPEGRSGRARPNGTPDERGERSSLRGGSAWSRGRQ